MTNFNKPTDERMESVSATVKTAPDFYRNQVIEEVAQEMAKFPFGKDTIDSLAIYIRSMKK